VSITVFFHLETSLKFSKQLRNILMY